MQQCEGEYGISASPLNLRARKDKILHFFPEVTAEAVVSACASTLPDAAACWYLLHTSATGSLPPLKGNLVSKAM